MGFLGKLFDYSDNSAEGRFTSFIWNSNCFTDLHSVESEGVRESEFVKLISYIGSDACEKTYFYYDKRVDHKIIVAIPLYMPINRGLYEKLIIQRMVNEINEILSENIRTGAGHNKYQCDIHNDGMPFLWTEMKKDDRLEIVVENMMEIYRLYLIPVLEKYQIDFDMRKFSSEENIFESVYGYNCSENNDCYYKSNLGYLKITDPEVFERIMNIHEKYCLGYV